MSHVGEIKSRGVRDSFRWELWVREGGGAPDSIPSLFKVNLIEQSKGKLDDFPSGSLPSTVRQLVSQKTCRAIYLQTFPSFDLSFDKTFKTSPASITARKAINYNLFRLLNQSRVQTFNWKTIQMVSDYRPLSYGI